MTQADPSNLEVLLSLGVSHTNELDQAEALDYMRRWLTEHPKYSHLAAQAALPDGPLMVQPVRAQGKTPLPWARWEPARAPRSAPRWEPVKAPRWELVRSGKRRACSAPTTSCCWDLSL